MAASEMVGGWPRNSGPSGQKPAERARFQLPDPSLEAPVHAIRCSCLGLRNHSAQE
jgi:hypothetical protein